MMDTAELERTDATEKYETREYWSSLIKMSLSKFFVLCALSDKAMHGYEISKIVDGMTNGCCAPTPGSLYPLLKEFETGGYVTSITDIVNGRHRKIYTITDRGRRAFAVAVDAWTEVGECVEAGAKSACNPGECC